jgi:hypothetical protein
MGSRWKCGSAKEKRSLSVWSDSGSEDSNNSSPTSSGDEADTDGHAIRWGNGRVLLRHCT